MEIEALIKKMKDIYLPFIDFIEASDDNDAEFKTLINILEKQEILASKDEVRLLFQLISKIADDHHRTSDFFDKLERIFQYLIKDIPSPISYFIPDYTKYNKLILFLLLEKGFIKPDETFLNQYLQSKPNQTFYYLYPKMKKFLEEKLQKQIEEEILSQKYSETISTFEEKCQKGENDSYICSLIRSDSIEEFISYIKRAKLSLLTKIKPSVYETNSFLIDKEPTLIEYAAFFGSIQIIRYLKYDNVPLTSSLWTYTIHSNNPELIHFLEENEVEPERNQNKELFDDVLKESIKCHHNAITNYITDNFYEQIQTDDQNHFYGNFSDTVANSLNFFFFPNEIESIICKQKNLNGFKLSQLCFSLTQITIPSSVTEIGYYAFSYCSSLIQVKIPSSVTSIGNSSFYGCSSLTQITIPSSVTSIGDQAFNGCSSLTNIEFEIPSSLKLIGKNCFEECKSLIKLFIPSSVTSYELQSFEGFKSLTQVSIPSTVTKIRYYAFSSCSSLTQITIPSSVKKIGNYAFSECSSLTQITIPSSVTSIGDNAFSGCSSLTQITIPSSVTSIGDYAFCDCSSLTQITIPSSVTSIGDYAFCDCSSLTQITIPSSVTSIGDYAFSGCSSLTQITIPSSVTSIGNNAFNECSSLTQITIPSSVNSINNFAFLGCSSLQQINGEPLSKLLELSQYEPHKQTLPALKPKKKLIRKNRKDKKINDYEEQVYKTRKARNFLNDSESEKPKEKSMIMTMKKCKEKVHYIDPNNNNSNNLDDGFYVDTTVMYLICIFVLLFLYLIVVSFIPIKNSNDYEKKCPFHASCNVTYDKNKTFITVDYCEDGFEKLEDGLIQICAPNSKLEMYLSTLKAAVYISKIDGDCCFKHNKIDMILLNELFPLADLELLQYDEDLLTKFEKGEFKSRVPKYNMLCRMYKNAFEVMPVQTFLIFAIVIVAVLYYYLK